MQRLIILGASNVTRAFGSLVNMASDVLQGPLEVVAAHGHGRSFGAPWSTVLVRKLPGILHCGLWEAVARDERPTQRETLQQIRAALPMLDPNDRDARGMAASADIRFDRGRRVHLHEDWRTGARLLDSHARAELLRAATA